MEPARFEETILLCLLARMIELLQDFIKPYNLPFTLLLGLIIFYWLTALLGVIDLDGEGGDIDMDAGGEGDTDAGDVDDSGESVWNAVLRVVGLSDAPAILVISLFSLFLWAFNVIANMHFNPAESNGRAAVLLLPVVILAFLAMRLSLRFIRPVFQMIRAPEADARVIGQEGVVKSATIDSAFGRVEIEYQGKPLLLNAVISDEETALNKGDRVLVVLKEEKTNKYIVRSI